MDSQIVTTTLHGVLIVLMYMCGYAKYDVHVVLHISLFSFMFYYFSPSCCSTQECLLWVSLSLLHLSSPIPSLSSPTHHHHQPTLLVRTALHLILQATARISRVPQNTFCAHWALSLDCAVRRVQYCNFNALPSHCGWLFSKHFYCLLSQTVGVTVSKLSMVWSPKTSGRQSCE